MVIGFQWNDDENLINGDGCDQHCYIQPNFICSVTFNSTICQYRILLQLQIYKITKNSDNSATIIIKAINSNFPFPFGPTDFSQSSSIKHVNISLVDSQDSSKNELLKSEVLKSYSNEIHLLVKYDKQIQNFPSMIVINTTKTKYHCDQNKAILHFILRGDNTRLELSKNQQLYGGISKGILINTIITDFLFFVGLVSNKYIGLQAILTLQLMYYSQLLINPVEIWPSRFQSLQYLKYSNGYNQFINFTNYVPKTSIQKKFNYIGIQKFPIENYNLSSIILIFFYVLLVITTVYSKYNPYDQNTKQNKKKENNNKQTVKKYFENFINQYLNFQTGQYCCFQVHLLLFQQFPSKIQSSSINHHQLQYQFKTLFYFFLFSQHYRQD